MGIAAGIPWVLEHDSCYLLFQNYTWNVRFNALAFFQEHIIVLAGLSVHTSHALQFLDISSVFGPMKQALKRLFSCPSVRTIRQRNTLNGLSTVRNLLHMRYPECVTSQTIFAGFYKNEIWSDILYACALTQISEVYFTSSSIDYISLSYTYYIRSMKGILECKYKPAHRMQTYKDL